MSDSLREPSASPESVWSDYDFTRIPFEELIRVGQRTLLYRDLFVVSWILGRFCNYRCSYCWPYARADKPDHRPLPVITATIDEIKRQARERGFNSFHFSFSGGEPSLHPQYRKILEHLAADVPNVNYQSLHMTTNLSRPLSWYQGYATATAGFHRVSVTASYHKEFAKRELFRDRLLFLIDHDVNVTINMVMVPERFDRLWEDALFFHEAGLNVTLKPQSNSSATRVVDGYTPEQLQLLKNGMPQRDYTKHHLAKMRRPSLRPKPRFALETPDELAHSLSSDSKSVPPLLQVEFVDRDNKKWYLDQAERFNSFNFNRFKGWECSAGYRSIVIREPDGSIKRSYSCHEKPLGFLETGFRLFDRPQPCVTESCVSSADSKIPKRKPSERVPLWPGDKTFEV